LITLQLKVGGEAPSLTLPMTEVAPFVGSSSSTVIRTWNEPTRSLELLEVPPVPAPELFPLPLLPEVLLLEPAFALLEPAVLAEPPLPSGSPSELEQPASAAPRAKKYAEPENLRRILEFVIGSSVFRWFGAQGRQTDQSILKKVPHRRGMVVAAALA
jgi:hypothetical protein